MTTFACTPNNYSSHRQQIISNSRGFTLFPAYDTQTPNLKQTLDSVNVLGETSVQEYPLGSRLERGIEKWRYCKNGATGLNIGAPVQNVALMGSQYQADDIAVKAAVAIGGESVRLTPLAEFDIAGINADDDFVGGYLIVNDAAGEGQCCLIKANSAPTAYVADDFEVALHDKLTIALTTSSQVGLIKNPYNGVVVCPAVMSGFLVGIPQLAVTASYYFWCKTAGPSAVVVGQVFGVGSIARIGSAAGAATATVVDTAGSRAAFSDVKLGVSLTPGAAVAEYCVINLEVD